MSRDRRLAGEGVCIQTLGDLTPAPMLIKLPLNYSCKWVSYEDYNQSIFQNIIICYKLVFGSPTLLFPLL